MGDKKIMFLNFHPIARENALSNEQVARPERMLGSMRRWGVLDMDTFFSIC
jgi:hypothetical protein